MIYGSHNSLSAYKPSKWYMRLINFTSKCQNKYLFNQIQHNCRYFDIRLRKVNGQYLGAHGLVTYDIPISYALNEIEFGHSHYNNNEGGIYYRLVHENSIIDDGVSFEEFCKDMEEYINDYPNLQCIQITSKKYWQTKYIHPLDYIGSYNYPNTKEGIANKKKEIGNMPLTYDKPTLCEMYISGNTKLGIPYPKKSAKKLRVFIEKSYVTGINVIDFI